MMIFPMLTPALGFVAVEANTLAHAKAEMLRSHGVSVSVHMLWTAADLIRNDLFAAFTQNLPAGARVWNGDAEPVTV